MSDQILDLDALQPGYANNPYPIYARLRRSDPVRRVRLGGVSAWLVTRHEDVRRALNDPRLSSSLDNLSPDLAEGGAWVAAERMMQLDRHMLRSDPPVHSRLRRLVSKAFTPGRIEALRPRVHETVDQLMAEFLPKGSAELIDEFAFPMPLMIIMELLGLPKEDRDQFRRWSEQTKAQPGDPDAQQRQMEGFGAIRQYLAELVELKTRQPEGSAEDLLSALVAVRDEGERLDEDELLSMAWLLLQAGHVTTVDLIAGGMLALLSNPDQLALLRADPERLPSAIEELLRYDSPIKIGIARFTTEEVSIGEVVIPGGEVVLLALASANRDPDRFTDPDRLDLGRETTGHLAFGHAIHYCLGAPLARLEATVAMRSLLDRCADLSLDIDPADLEWQLNPHLRGLVRLPVTFTPALPAWGRWGGAGTGR